MGAMDARDRTSNRAARLLTVAVLAAEAATPPYFVCPTNSSRVISIVLVYFINRNRQCLMIIGSLFVTCSVTIYSDSRVTPPGLIPVEICDSPCFLGCGNAFD